MRKCFFGIAAAITLVFFLGATSTCQAYFGEIIKNLGAMSSTDAGGIAFKPDDPDHFYEAWRKKSTIWKRQVSDGTVVETIPIYWRSPHPSAGVMGMSWDLNRQVFWISDAYGAAAGTTIATLPAAGGYATARFDMAHSSGLDYYEPGDELWVANATNGYVRRYTPEGEILGSITPAMADPQGVIRIDDNLWITDWAGGSNYITEYDLSGQLTGSQILISGREGFYYNAAALDLCFDGKYLWALTCNPCRVIQIDIGYTTPTPTPAPTPAGLILDSGDYDGDSTSDIAIFRESSGMWAIKGITRAYFGTGSDIPASGDYDGDGTTDIAVYRGSAGLWAIQGVTRTYFGGSSDIPVPGDYNGDGACDASIFRGSSGLWAVRGITRAYFGGSSDLPVPLYGSGRAAGKDMGIFRPSTGLWAIRGLTRAYFGAGSDQPVAGNYTGIPDAFSLGIFRDSTGLWAVRGVTRVYFGSGSDRPVPGNYTGFIPEEIGIFRNSAGLWAIRNVTRTYFGTTGDIPVSGLAINPSSAVLP